MRVSQSEPAQTHLRRRPPSCMIVTAMIVTVSPQCLWEGNSHSVDGFPSQQATLTKRCCSFAIIMDKLVKRTVQLPIIWGYIFEMPWRTMASMKWLVIYNLIHISMKFFEYGFNRDRWYTSYFWQDRDISCTQFGWPLNQMVVFFQCCGRSGLCPFGFVSVWVCGRSGLWHFLWDITMWSLVWRWNGISQVLLTAIALSCMP